MLLFKYLFLNVVIYQEIRYFHKVMLILEVNNLLNPTLTKARFMPEASNTLPSNYFNFILFTLSNSNTHKATLMIPIFNKP